MEWFHFVLISLRIIDLAVSEPDIPGCPLVTASRIARIIVYIKALHFRLICFNLTFCLRTSNTSILSILAVSFIATLVSNFMNPDFDRNNLTKYCRYHYTNTYSNLLQPMELI